MITPDKIALLRSALDSYTRTRTRLREAGQRAAVAETMRAAAIAEMGQAIRDHRAVLAEHGEGASHARIHMDDAQELTGLSRRTLSDAVSRDSGRSDQEIACEYRDYGYEDTDGNGAELHRRYPHLMGLRQAIEVLGRMEAEQWEAEHGPAPLISLMDAEGPRPSPQRLALTAEYQRQVDRIADGRPLAGA